MKFVIAPDSFKESLSAVDAAAAIKRGFERVFPSAWYDVVPLADGGEGTSSALVAASGGRIHQCRATGPLGQEVDAHFGVLADGETAVVEVAAASGLALIRPENRNPELTTSYGTGELIRAALELGCQRFIVGLGGSASNDGGAGLLEALGLKFLDKKGKPIGRGGGALAKLAAIESTTLDPRVKTCRVLAACDVDNLLLGQQGASHVYGPQKGGSPEQIERLDRALAIFAAIAKRFTGFDASLLPGGGAAGGIGAGLAAFLGAELRPGFRLISDATGLAEKIESADLVLTGEGRLDQQSAHGKAPIGAAMLAQGHGIPVAAFCGQLGPGFESLSQLGVTYFRPIAGPDRPLTELMTQAGTLLEEEACRFAGELKAGGRLS